MPYSDARTLEAMGQVKITDKEYVSTAKEVVDTNYMYRKGWSNRRMTRIAWAQNYEKAGGAEISCYNIIQAGSSLGYDIVGWVVGGENATNDFEILRSSDLVIVNNLHFVDQDKERLLKWLWDNKKPYVKYDHDCFEKEKLIYQNSKLNIFISPMHKQHYTDYVGSEIDEKSIVLPLAFDVDRWHKEGEHKAGTIFIPSYIKCRENAQEFVKNNPNFQFFVADDVIPIGKNVTRLGKIEYTQMQNYYPKYESVYHCPLLKCAGERILFEAVMSGCKVITNEKAGHISWKFDWQNDVLLKETLREAVYKFWAEIDKVIR